MSTRKKYAGRQKGTPNKVTAAIRQIVQRNVDFDKLIEALFKRARRKYGDAAAKLLLEYGWGKAREMNGQSGTDYTQVAREFAKMVQAAGTGFATPADQRLPDTENKIQNGSRGSQELQDRNREKNPDNGGALPS